MVENYTIFISYILEPTGTTNSHGYGKAIHCNYIKTTQMETDNILAEELRVTFSGGTTGTSAGFKFLSDNISAGTGYTAHKIYALIQLINNSGYTNTNDIKPISSDWKIFDMTDQCSGYTSGGTYMLTAEKILFQTLKIPLLHYWDVPATTFIPYDLAYLNYPSELPIDNDKLCFGAETYFLGTVITDIKADVFVTDLSIDLPLNEFNSTSNLTWDGVSSVSITEIGIYDENKNLVAIGKLNDPIEKNDSVSRTILFAIDF